MEYAKKVYETTETQASVSIQPEKTIERTTQGTEEPWLQQLRDKIEQMLHPQYFLILY